MGNKAGMRKILGWVFSIIWWQQNQACLTTDNVPCVFPFTYKSISYAGCTDASDSPGNLWCATKVDENGSYINESKLFGYCAADCPDDTLFLRTIEDDNKHYENDKGCQNDETCKDQNSYPEFLKKKENLYKLKRNSQEYTRALKKVKNSICNRSKQKVCCAEKCKGGHPCLKEDQCEFAQDLRKKFRNGDNKAREDLIGLICDRKKRTFCCPPKVGPSPRVNPKLSPKDNQDPSWLPAIGECGSNPDVPPPRVLGGVATSPGMFPFTALLGYPNTKRRWSERLQEWFNDDSPKYKCGGTLINHWYVVTAAHCQGKTTGSQISSVRLGEWEVGRDPDCIRGSGTCLDKVQDFRITFDQVRVHEDFGRSSTGNIVNDIALVRLDRPAVLNKGVQIVCLPLDHDAAADELNLPNLEDGLTGKYPHVVGWGYTEYDSSVSGQEQGDFSTDNVASTVQQMLGVPVLSAEECDELWGGYLAVEETQICAGGQRGKDSCKGDSGGPLYLARVTSSGLPLLDGLEPVYLLGLVSFGSRVCGEGRPGVYTRLSSFMPWIKEHIGRGDK